MKETYLNPDTKRSKRISSDAWEHRLRAGMEALSIRLAMIIQRCTKVALESVVCYFVIDYDMRIRHTFFGMTVSQLVSTCCINSWVFAKLAGVHAPEVNYEIK
jgi:hypothetical protein